MARQYLTLVGMVVGLAALPVQGQTDGDRRVVAVNVLDHDGNHVPGLTANAFRGQFRGEQVRILSAVEDSSSRRIALLVDTSQSMGDSGRAVSLAWSAARQLIGDLTPKHGIALFTVGETLQEHTRFTTDHRALESAMEQAKARRPGGSSSLYDGVARATQSFETPGFGDVLYLVTDGMDTTSQLEDRDAERSAARTGIRVFVVRLPIESRFSVVKSQAESWTLNIAEATGGAVLRVGAWKTTEASKRLQAFSSLITDVYRLEVALPRTVDRYRSWTLEVVDATGRKRKDLRVVYPRLLVPSSDE